MAPISERNQVRKGRPAAGVLVIHEDRVLLVKHGPKAYRKEGMFGIPGGGVRSIETLEEAARRELKEETGLEIENLTSYPENVYRRRVKRDYGQKEYDITVFIGEGIKGNLKENRETKPVWVEISTLKKRRKLMPSVVQIVYDGLKARET